MHPAFAPGRVAVITGAASGIGLAAAKAYAGLGMKLVLADIDGAALAESAATLAGATVITRQCDVSRREDVVALETAARAAFGEIAVVMNNAAREGGGQLFGEPERWRAALETNLWGVIHGVQVFTPGMIAQHTPCAVINTGSKQGITTPPGDTAYNVTKAGVKVVTEALAHELRGLPGCAVTAHLLIPGFTFTGFTRVRTQQKPDAAWWPEQVIGFMLDRIARGDFYILCPDNAVTRAMDEKRMRWAAEDIILNRPALSRWHPEYAAAFAAYMAQT